MGGHVARVAETRNQHRSLVTKPVQKIPLGRSKCSGSVIFRVGVCRLDSYGQDLDQ